MHASTVRLMQQCLKMIKPRHRLFVFGLGSYSDWLEYLLISSNKPPFSPLSSFGKWTHGKQSFVFRIIKVFFFINRLNYSWSGYACFCCFLFVRLCLCCCFSLFSLRFFLIRVFQNIREYMIRFTDPGKEFVGLEEIDDAEYLIQRLDFSPTA